MTLQLDRLPLPRFLKGISLWKANSLWLSWIFVGALALLCALLAVIQSRWIEQIGNAQRQRLQTNLQNGLNRLSFSFDSEIVSSCSALIPSFGDLQRMGTETACARQYAEWKQTHEPIFSRIGILHSGDFLLLDLDSGTFAPAEWPQPWPALRGHATSGSGGAQHPALLEFRLFGTLHPHPDAFPEPPPVPEQGPPQEDSLLLELNTAYLSQKMLPELIAKNLENPDSATYDAKVISALKEKAPFPVDGSVAILDPGRLQAAEHRDLPRPQPFSSLFEQPGWLLVLHRRGTSVDDMVSALRWRNFAVSGGILLLIVTMVAALVQFSRRANQLAQLQLNFVAGVSHDLRTPLTVIRTAAYNLRGRIAARPEQVERYGQLILTESEKLTLLVEQVLRYNAARSGHLLGERYPSAVAPLLESSLESSLAVPAGSGVIVEKSFAPNLPLIEADELALRHAFQNLFDNAVKYGLEGSNWIGVSARVVVQEETNFVEIDVSDRGPGIPAREQATVFDAFVRGERALQDHITGTGLGLNLVKRIVEAHGGSIRLVSGPSKGASFILRLPAAGEALQNEFANTAG